MTSSACISRFFSPFPKISVYKLSFLTHFVRLRKKNGTIFDGTCAFTCIQHCDKIGLKTSVFIHSKEYSMPENMGAFLPDGGPYQS